MTRSSQAKYREARLLGKSLSSVGAHQLLTNLGSLPEGSHLLSAAGHPGELWAAVPEASSSEKHQGLAGSLELLSPR